MIPGSDDIKRFETGTWWIDEEGEFHDAELIDPSFDTLFVRHLGHIKLETEGTHMSLTWDVTASSESAIGAAIDQLVSRPGLTEVRLNFFHLGWMTEGLTSAGAAIERVYAVQQFRSVTGMPLTKIEVADTAAVKDAPAGIRRTFELWRRTQGRLTEASQDECAVLLPEILIYRPSITTGRLVFSWVGNRSFSTMVHGRAWARRALRAESVSVVGSETADYVDRISAAYREVWTTGEPHYARIQTLLNPQEAADPVWLKYHRLLLPYRLHDGKAALICVSKPEAGSFSKPLDAVP
ncbi:MAG: hypothetical protein RIC16_07110 [Rhodospirillales bacterium]